MNIPMVPFFMFSFISRNQLCARRVAAAVLLCMFCGPAAAAPIAIEIIGGGGNQIPITVVPFANEDRFTQRMAQIISADLQRSGLFKLGSIGSARPLPAEPSEINYRYWKGEGAETMVIGSVSEKTDGHAEVRFLNGQPGRLSPCASPISALRAFAFCSAGRAARRSA